MIFKPERRQNHAKTALMHDFPQATTAKSCIRPIIWKNSAQNWKYLERAHDFQTGSPPKPCENGIDA